MVKFADPELFKAIVNQSTGIRALQRTDEKETKTVLLGDESLPEDIRNDWNKIAEYLTTPSE